MTATQGLLGQGCLLNRIELNKAVPPVPAVHLLGQTDSLDQPKVLEQIPNILLGGLECQILDCQFGSLGFLLLYFCLQLLDFLIVLQVGLLLGHGQHHSMPIYDVILKFLDGLLCLLLGSELDEPVPHGLPIFVPNDPH